MNTAQTYLTSCETLGIEPWRVGARYVHPDQEPARVVRVTATGVVVLTELTFELRTHADGDGGTPDFDDDGTLGCLAAVVREAWGDPLACCIARGPDSWEVRIKPPTQWGHVADGDTEAEAWVAALEAKAAEVTS